MQFELFSTAPALITARQQMVMGMVEKRWGEANRRGNKVIGCVNEDKGGDKKVRRESCCIFCVIKYLTLRSLPCHRRGGGGEGWWG